VRKPKDGDKFIINYQNQSWTLNGAIYISRWDFLLQNKSVVTAEAMPFEMDASSSIDIDTPEDWDAALKAMKDGL
jgi:CMP-N-acetylneuraminic acid synthetase